MHHEAAEAAGFFVSAALLLEHSGFAAGIRGATWIYPAANVLHVLGVATLFGSIAAFDLRVLGWLRAGGSLDTARLALPLARIGVVIVLPTGTLLFAAEASAYIVNPVFQVKLAAIAVAFANLALFHAGSFRRIADWPGEAPATARAAAGLSLVAWTIALVCGRFAAYV